MSYFEKRRKIEYSHEFTYKDTPSTNGNIVSPHKRQRITRHRTYSCYARRGNVGRSCRRRLPRQKHTLSPSEQIEFAVVLILAFDPAYEIVVARAFENVGVVSGGGKRKRKTRFNVTSEISEKEKERTDWTRELGEKKGLQQVLPSLLWPVAKGQYTGCRLHGNRSSGRNSSPDKL